MSDVTEHERVEKALWESERRFRVAVEISSEWISELDAKTGHLKWFGNTMERLGYSHEDIPRTLEEWHEIIHPDDRGRVINSILQHLKSREPYYEEYRVKRKDGTYLYVTDRGKIVVDEGNNQKWITVNADITPSKQAEWALNERTKELNCLYSISTLVEEPGIDFDGILKGVISIIPGAWQYSDITCARIVFGEKIVAPNNFKETPWKQSAPIEVRGKNVGILEVYYSEPKPASFEGPFLREERDLINAIAERLARIIERLQTEEDIKRRLEIEKTISKISSYFVGISNIDDCINASLSDLGRLSHSSRAYVFIFTDDATKMSNTHEWCAEGVTPQMENLRNLPTNIFPWWMEKLRKGEVINIEDPSKLPAEARNERKILLEDQGIKSLLVLPLNVGQEIAGFVGFDNIVTTGRWSDHDLALLRVSSKIISDAIRHERLQDELKNHAEILEKRVHERTEEIERLNATITERLIQKIAQISHISDLREIIRKSSGTEDSLERIIDGAIEDLELDVAAILLLNDRSGTIDVRLLKSKMKVEGPTTYGLDKPFVECECLNTNKATSVVVGNGLSILGTKIVHCAPISIRNETKGIFATGSMNDRTCDESELSVLGLYSGLASSVLEAAGFSVEPAKEAAKTGKRKYRVDPGTSLIVQDDVDLAYDIFVDHIMAGIDGLMITRVFPKKIREKYGLEKTPIIWLNDEKLDGQLTVNNVQDLSIAISNYVAKTEKPVILIDGIEYLISRGGFDPVLRFLQTKRSQVESSNSVLLVALFKDAIDPKEARLVQREFQTFKVSNDHPAKVS